MENPERDNLAQQRAGGIAALYIAAAYIAAMAYFLLIVDYQGAVDPAAKVALLVGKAGSLYVVNLVSYVVFGLALAVAALALHDRFEAGARPLARATAGLGLMWACLLVASGAVANLGMESVVGIYARDPDRAAAAWQLIEPIADGLGGGGGEALGGPWVLAASWAALRSKRLPKSLAWLGLAIGAIGVASMAPPLREAAYAFGLLQIPWFAWLGISMLRKERRAA